MENERLRDLNLKDVAQGKYVLYWMFRSKRISDNPALAYAVEQANAMQLPLVSIFVILDAFPFSRLIHNRIVLEGIEETATEMQKKNYPFFIILGDMINTVPRWAQNAALVVSDTGYLRYQLNWKTVIAHKSPCRMIEVEGNYCFPVDKVYDRDAYNAKVLRNRIYKLLPEFELKLCNPLPLKTPLPVSVRQEMVNITERHGEFFIDHKTLVIDTPKALGKYIDKISDKTEQDVIFSGGYIQAQKRLKRFIAEVLPSFRKNRNNPALNYQSNLSPYFHFGYLSIREALQGVISALDISEQEFFQTVISVKPGLHSNDKINGGLEFFEEAVVRRELSLNFCYYNEDYDQYSALPEWARSTLRNHVSDPRSYYYSLNSLEDADTHDKYWNAAQIEMVKTGKMHGYMRMYWCKKIIEWSRDPEDAYQIALHLNNKYELDGRDPNGFAGVAWCFGKHDRAWPAHPIFGTVRVMKDTGLERKFDMQKYINRIEQL